MSSSSRSSAVNSACAPNGSSGSGSVVSEKLRARLLGALPKARDRPGRGAGPPLCLRWLFGAGVPAMTSFSPRRPRQAQPCPQKAWLVPTARAPQLTSATSGSQPTGQSAVSQRAQRDDVSERAVTPGRSLRLCLDSVQCYRGLPVLRDRGASVRPPLWLSAWHCVGYRALEERFALSRDRQPSGVSAS